MKFEIYQNRCREGWRDRFRSYDYMNRRYGRIPERFYETVLKGFIHVRNKEEALETLYDRYNSGIKGKMRSVGISDVIKLDNEYYFCDIFGWKKLEEFVPMYDRRKHD